MRRFVMNHCGKMPRRAWFYPTIAGVFGLIAGVVSLYGMCGIGMSAMGEQKTSLVAEEQPVFIITDFGAAADDQQLDTEALQKAIDRAAEVQGTVRVPAGRFVLGRVRLRSGIRLVLEQGAVLQGSRDWRDYGSGQWTDSLFLGEDVNNVRIEGPGTIDGADCERPGGEEGFRGPHAIRLVRSKDVVIRDVTITGAGNYAIICLECANIEVNKVRFRGGHDGVHAQACQDFRVLDCDFRTGDDCLAGCDNVNFVVSRCQINSSCNGFRLGCVHLRVEDCQFWGPGEFPHRITIRRGKPRTNMLSAFVHFAPTDRNPKLPSDDWLVRNCTMKNVDRVYAYDFEKGVWQTGQPAQRLVFENITAEGIAYPLQILGDQKRQLELTLRNVTISLRPEKARQSLIEIARFGKLHLENVVLTNDGSVPVIRARDGNAVILRHVSYPQACHEPFQWVEVSRVENTP